MELADLVTKMGFDDEADFHKLVADADLSTDDRQKAFKRWQHGDGTKAGLVALNRGVKTPTTYPDHHVVGHYYGGSHFGMPGAQIYRCMAYDPAYDYLLVSITGPPDERKVSPRAINATFWPAEERADYWYIPQWGCRVWKHEPSVLFHWFEKNMPGMPHLATCQGDRRLGGCTCGLDEMKRMITARNERIEAEMKRVAAGGGDASRESVARETLQMAHAALEKANT